MKSARRMPNASWRIVEHRRDAVHGRGGVRDDPMLRPRAPSSLTPRTATRSGGSAGSGGASEMTRCAPASRCRASSARGRRPRRRLEDRVDAEVSPRASARPSASETQRDLAAGDVDVSLADRDLVREPAEHACRSGAGTRGAAGSAISVTARDADVVARVEQPEEVAADAAEAADARRVMVTVRPGRRFGHEPTTVPKTSAAWERVFTECETLSHFVDSRQELGADARRASCPIVFELVPFEPRDERVEVGARELEGGEALVVVSERVEDLVRAALDRSAHLRAELLEKRRPVAVIGAPPANAPRRDAASVSASARTADHAAASKRPRKRAPPRRRPHPARPHRPRRRAPRRRRGGRTSERRSEIQPLASAIAPLTNGPHDVPLEPRAPAATRSPTRIVRRSASRSACSSSSSASIAGAARLELPGERRLADAADGEAGGLSEQRRARKP